MLLNIIKIMQETINRIKFIKKKKNSKKITHDVADKNIYTVLIISHAIKCCL